MAGWLATWLGKLLFTDVANAYEHPFEEGKMCLAYAFRPQLLGAGTRSSIRAENVLTSWPPGSRHRGD